MHIIQVNDKHQLTLPYEVIQSLQLSPNGYIEYEITPNGVFFRHLDANKKNAPENGILRFAKAGRKSYLSAAEADAFISQQRDQW